MSTRPSHPSVSEPQRLGKTFIRPGNVYYSPHTGRYIRIGERIRAQHPCQYEAEWVYQNHAGQWLPDPRPPRLIAIEPWTLLLDDWQLVDEATAPSGA